MKKETCSFHPCAWEIVGLGEDVGQEWGSQLQTPHFLHVCGFSFLVVFFFFLAIIHFGRKSPLEAEEGPSP